VKPGELAPEMHRALSGSEGVVEGLAANGAPALVAYEALETVPWVIAAGYPLSEAYVSVNSSRSRIAMVSAAFILVAAALLWALLYRSLNPLAVMRDELKEAVSNPTAQIRLPVRGNDEISDLARAYNELMTSRHAIETELRESRAQLRLVIDSVPALIAYTDRNEHIRFCGGQPVPGLPAPSAIIGKTEAEILGPTAYEFSREHIRAALAGYRQRFERVDMRDGKAWTSQVDYVPDVKADGTIAGYFSLVQDVTETRRIQHSLMESEQRLRLIANNIPALVSYTDRHSRFVFASDGFEDAFGVDHQTIAGRHVAEVLGPLVWEQTRSHVELALQGYREHFERIVHRDGRMRVELVDYVPDIQDDCSIAGFFALIQDITDAKRMQQQLAESEQRIRLIADNVPALISYIDKEGVYRFNNRLYERWLGRPLSEITDQPMRDVYPPDVFARLEPQLKRAIAGEQVEFEETFVTEQGERHVRGAWLPHRNSRGEIVGVYGISHDVTPLKLAERQLAELARSDTLTGLPNRRAFDEALPAALDRGRASGGVVALMYLDVDYFKKINDTMGHVAGDSVLKEFARRLRASVRQLDFVARIAGDEFIVIVERLKNEEEASLVARKIVDSMRVPFRVGGGDLTVTTSIGVALVRGGRTTVKRLMREADRALYSTKAAGRNGFTVAHEDSGPQPTLPQVGRLIDKDGSDIVLPLV
ncbi:MAG TPA: diguanylate cyclase, partial [Burkholderiaceae bacterium]|nr:diguanylate cyclase [Burkholderiaceae bacterium]